MSDRPSLGKIFIWVDTQSIPASSALSSCARKVNDDIDFLSPQPPLVNLNFTYRILKEKEDLSS
jgi:hypothetical protein